MRFCTICREPITDPKRMRIESPYCSQACKDESDKMRREARRREFCEACGRKHRKRSTEQLPIAGRPCAAAAQDIQGATNEYEEQHLLHQ